jgi:hypothetical protein
MAGVGRLAMMMLQNVHRHLLAAQMEILVSFPWI